MSKVVYMNRSMPQVRLLRSRAGTLQAEVDGALYDNVRIIRCFPYSHPDRYLSVQTMDGMEVQAVDSLEQLTGESLALATDALREHYMVPCITAIQDMKKRGSHWIWSVQTEYGAAKLLLMNLHDNIQKAAEGRWIVTDEDGRRFEFRDHGRLDARTLKLWRNCKL